jgi:hypothetical protein
MRNFPSISSFTQRHFGFGLANRKISNNIARCFVVLNGVLVEGNALGYERLTNCPKKFKYMILGKIRLQVGSLVYHIRSTCTIEPNRCPSTIQQVKVRSLQYAAHIATRRR